MSMAHTEVMDLLAQSALFYQAPVEALHAVAANLHYCAYQPGEWVVWEGEPTTHVYLIARGAATVSRLGREGTTPRTYLLRGQSFGEAGILDQRPHAASVVALTALEVLALRQADFLALLSSYPTLGIALAHTLSHALSETARPPAGPDGHTHLILLGGLELPFVPAGLGHALSLALGRHSSLPTVYLPLGEPGESSPPVAPRAPAPADYDILRPALLEGLPAAAASMVLRDQILGQYRYAVVLLPDLGAAASQVWLEQATHLVVVLLSGVSAGQRLQELRSRLTRYTAFGRLSLTTVVTADPAGPAPLIAEADEILAAPDVFTPPGDATIPPPLRPVIDRLITRLDRAHQLAIYIPTTVAVDRPADTSLYVERTLAFLGTRFGGATRKQAQGVWQSAQAGLVQEDVYLVQTYASDGALTTHLEEVVTYARELKQELQQEALAVEVDQKLLLI